ncbi:MAG: LuxR family transcriptional regulator [Rhodobacterales bacterium]|nr:MAG: LuxR family transcriptional regulator [Rhodobacterales bacterium]
MELIDLSSVDQTDDRFDRFLEDLCQRLEFDYASYATVNLVSGDVQGFATYPEDWIIHYAQHEFHRIDPTLHISMRSIAPVDWERLERDSKFNSVFRNAPDFGITDRGITVPVRGPYGDCGVLNVTRDTGDTEWDKLKNHVIGDLQMAAVHMHDNVMQSNVLTAALHRPALSSREIEIIKWTALGKSQQDIGDILSISHRTVEVHLRSAREKLGALTTAQAIGRAVGLGLAHPG